MQSLYNVEAGGTYGNNNHSSTHFRTISEILHINSRPTCKVTVCAKYEARIGHHHVSTFLIKICAGNRERLQMNVSIITSPQGRRGNTRNQAAAWGRHDFRDCSLYDISFIVVLNESNFCCALVHVIIINRQQFKHGVQ
jgi:hypothetical protein